MKIYLEPFVEEFVKDLLRYLILFVFAIDRFNFILFYDCSQWTTGSKCRARWSTDGKLYDATIVSKHPDNRTCTVRYNEYNNEEILPLLSLLPARSDRRSTDGQFATSRSSQSHACYQFSSLSVGLL